MLRRKILDLLLANHKTGKQLLELAIASPFKLQDIEDAFIEVQHYEMLEKCIRVAQEQNVSLLETAVHMRRG